MTYDYNSKIYLAETVLNVKDLARQTAFYTQVIGLEILSQTATIWKTLKAMVLSSIETSLLLNGIFVRMVASLVSQKSYQPKKFTRWDARLSLL